MQTEFAFTLPRGYVDAAGAVHRDGHDAARDGAGRDRAAARSRRCAQNEAYLAVLLLSRVVTRIGDVTDVTPAS